MNRKKMKFQFEGQMAVASLQSKFQLPIKAKKVTKKKK